jgi:sugar phosphate isomerase/epimerase
MIDCALSWGIPSVSISPGPLYTGDEPDGVLQQLAVQLRPLAESALRSGCRVALENVPRHCLATREGMALALTHLGPAVGVCLDTGNALLDPPVSRWLEEFGPSIVKMHLSDGHVRGDSFTPTLPGRGEVPWDEVREGVGRIGCPPDLFVEAPLPAGVSEVSFIEEAVRAVRAVWGS